MPQCLLKEQDIEVCSVVKGVELLLIAGKKVGRYLLITDVRRVAHNDVEAADVSSQEICLADIFVKRERKTKFFYPAATRGDFRLINVVGVDILSCLKARRFSGG